MCEIGAIILVDRETESAFKAPNVVFEEVGIFVEVDGFECEFAETFAAIGICGGLRGDTTAAKFATCTILVVHGCDRCGGRCVEVESKSNCRSKNFGMYAKW
jgi:hypothetical protein